MSGYTKVFSGMLDSSVWQLSKEARLLWVTMLLKKDREQVVKAAVPGLAHAARLTIEEVEGALGELSKPDPYSQTPDNDGRRIVRLADGRGWLIVNGAKYRDMMSVEDRRAYKAAWQREYRARKKGGTPLAGERNYVKTLENEGQAAADRLIEQSIPVQKPPTMPQDALGGIQPPSAG